MRGLQELKKYNFNMETIKIFDAFAGVGALHQAHKYLGVETKIIGMSEIEIDAIISYAGVHINNFLELEFEYPSEDEMRKLLMDRNIGYSYEKGKSSIPRLKKDKLYKVYKATMLLNNLGDISMLDYDNMPNFDFFNLSFSCTDLSGAGEQKGMKNEDGTPTRSGLYIYGIKAIRSKKPKYVMIENVKGLIQKKFIDDFYSIIEELEEIGYNCYYPTKEDKKGNKSPVCLNTKNYAVPQNRERVFVYCVRKDLDDNQFEFNHGFESDIRLKDILEDDVDEKYYLSEEVQKRFKPNGKIDENRNELNQIGTTGEDKSIGQRDRTYGVNGIAPNLTATDYKQPKQILDNARLIQCGELDIKGNDSIKRVYDEEGLCPTLTTMGGGYREPKIVDDNAYKTEKQYRIRKLTPKECWLLQGFRSDLFDRAKSLGISDSSLYKLAGNSITIDVIYYNLLNLYKKYIIK